jgi:hypothetical protein
MLTFLRPSVRLVPWTAALLLAFGAPAALADSVTVTGPGSANAGQGVTFTVQGEASSQGSVPYEIRALMGTDECAADFLLTIGSNLVSLTGADPLVRTTGGAFSKDVTATPPAGGTYHVCAYVISTNQAAAMTLAKASSTLVVAGGKPAAKPPSRATLLKRALAKCKKTKSAKKRAACVRKAKKRYGAKR